MKTAGICLAIGGYLILLAFGSGFGFAGGRAAWDYTQRAFQAYRDRRRTDREIAAAIDQLCEPVPNFKEKQWPER